jgi:hypothetical protein
MKANRLSTKKKDSKMNHRDAQTAEEQRNSRETTTTTEAVSVVAETEASATGGKLKGEHSSPF